MKIFGKDIDMSAVPYLPKNKNSFSLFSLFINTIYKFIFFLLSEIVHASVMKQ